MKAEKKSANLILVLIVYLAGIFMGALDTGIVTPARTIIQNNLGVDATTGIWMITIYTLAFAASIPIMGKLADRYGRKYVYLASISLFGLGSLFCGLAQHFGGFSLLLAARAVQAIGGGGILPVATAEFGTTFPPEKRGMALGLVGGVFGIANIFGASVGSAILDLFGVNNWQFIFYVNVPITLFIVVAGFLVLNNGRTERSGKIDGLGIGILVAMVLSLLYGLKNLDFFHFTGTLATTGVYPFLLLFLFLLPVFILVEKRAQDPVMNLAYFSNRNIVLTLLISFASGFVLMGVVFVPQFAENALKIPSGSGGYLVIVLGLCAGIGAPLSGRLIDRFGAKIVLGFGFLVSILGASFLILVATSVPNLFTVLTSLAIIGTGMGFTVGTPLNYMMLANTEEQESNSALATLSLVRSIGTAIAPAIMIGFLAHAGGSVQSGIMGLLPKEVRLPELPYAQEISAKVEGFRNDPVLKDKLGNLVIPDFASMGTIRIDMNAGSEASLPEDLIARLQASDVTTITALSKVLAVRMFDERTPSLVAKIQGGLGEGISGIGQGISGMEGALAQMQLGYEGITQGINGMLAGIAGQEAALIQYQQILDQFERMGASSLPPGMTVADLLPAEAKAGMPPSVLEELGALKSAAEVDAKAVALEGSISALRGKLAAAYADRKGLEGGVSSLKASIAELKDLQGKMASLSGAVPSAFETAKFDYLKGIDAKSGEIEGAFQSTLNAGFRNIYLTSGAASAGALVLLSAYSRKRERTRPVAGSASLPGEA